MAESSTRELVIQVRVSDKALSGDMKRVESNISNYAKKLQSKFSSYSQLPSLKATREKAQTRSEKWNATHAITQLKKDYSGFIRSKIMRGPYVGNANKKSPFPDSVFNHEAKYKSNAAKSAYSVFEKAGMTKYNPFESFAPIINKASKAFEGLKTKLAPYIAIAEKAWKATKKVASALATVTKNTFKSVAGLIKSKVHLGEMAKKLKTLQKAFIRVITYKAIRTFLSILNSGLTTGVNNLYKFSSLLEGKFKTSMDNFATSWLYVQNAIGAFAGTIINAVMPVVTALMDRIAEIANMLARFSASLLGSSYYQATKQVQKYSDMLGEAAANQNQLMGFDELNVLSAGSGDVGSMFGDYSEFADGIGDVESVIDKLTDKINTFVQNFDIEALATKIGKKVNDIVKYFNQLMDGIDFSAMGRKLASGMNKLVETIKPAELGRALTQKINMVIDFIEGFVTKFEWGAAGTWLSNLVASWIDSIHWDKVQSAISGAINGIFAFAKAFITTTNWAEKAAHLAETINGLVNQIDWKEIGSTISKWITTLLDMAIAFFKGIDWKAVGRSIYETLAGIDWGDIFTKLGQLVLSAISAMVSTISSALSSRATTKRNEFVQSGSNWDYVPSDSSTTTTKTTTKDASWWEKYYGGSYATGGMPSTGSLFWAGEAGPELVTSVGGRSTVYNEQQLGASIALGNENVVAAINTLIGVVRSKNNNVTISASDIRKAVNSSSMRLGV